MTRADPNKLTDKQKIFVLEYLVDLNQTAAAIRAGYSEVSAKPVASNLMTQPKIKEAIEFHLSKRISKLEISGEKTLRNLDMIADVDIAEIFDENDCILPPREIPAHIRKTIAGIKVFEQWDWVDDPETGKSKKVKTGEIKDIKFWNKVHANELIGKNQKLFTDKVEVSGDTSLADSMRKARERRKDRQD